MRYEYDRMNPDERLIAWMREYTHKTYGTPAFTLSTAEALFILKRIDSLDKEIYLYNELFKRNNISPFCPMMKKTGEDCCAEYHACEEVPEGTPDQSGLY